MNAQRNRILARQPTAELQHAGERTRLAREVRVMGRRLRHRNLITRLGARLARVLGSLIVPVMLTVLALSVPAAMADPLGQINEFSAGLNPDSSPGTSEPGSIAGGGLAASDPLEPPPPPVHPASNADRPLYAEHERDGNPRARAGVPWTVDAKRRHGTHPKRSAPPPLHPSGGAARHDRARWCRRRQLVHAPRRDRRTHPRTGQLPPACHPRPRRARRQPATDVIPNHPLSPAAAQADLRPTAVSPRALTPADPQPC